jgi:hypothetical protein
MTKGAKPGADGRPWGCFYFPEDHERAARHVKNIAPIVFEWIKLHPDGLPDDMEMHQLLWRTTIEILQGATLIDHAEVALILRLEADPPTDAEKARIEKVRAAGEDWARRRNN